MQYRRIKQYSKRNQKIAATGSMSYVDFLNSDLWKTIKDSLKKRPQSKFCYFCGSEDRIDFHHVRYSRINLKSAKYILPVCRKCHEAIHKIENEKDILVVDATKEWRDKFRKTRAAEKAFTRSFFKKFWGTLRI